MSKYAELKTVFTDGEHLVSALTQMGFTPTRHEKPVTLTDYHGGKQLAHIVIPKAQLGNSWGDIGFFKDGGTFRAVIDDYDRDGRYGRVKYDDAWFGRLSQTYKEKQTMAVAKTKGYSFISRTVTPQGKVQLKFAVR